MVLSSIFFNFVYFAQFICYNIPIFKNEGVIKITLNIFLLLAGFVILVQAAKLFVSASVEIAKKLKMPPVVIGLTVMALGTSLPEAIISISAALNGNDDLAVANVVGANSFNLLFIVGLSALLFPITVKLKEISRDYWVSLAATAALFAMVLFLGDVIPRWGAGLLLAAFAAYMFVVVRKALVGNGFIHSSETPEAAKPLSRSIIFAILGAALIVLGGQLTVHFAIEIALNIGITERVVGLTVVAIGTSLPELVATLMACRKKQGELALGFIIGSGIFNIMFVLGISGLISPLAIADGVILDMVVLTFGTLLFFMFAHSNRRIVRLEGLIMVALYLTYMTFVVLI